MNTYSRRTFFGLALLLIVALSLPAASLAADKRLITEMDLFKFVWIADAQISPDGSRVAFVRVTSSPICWSLAKARTSNEGPEADGSSPKANCDRP